VLFDGGLRLQGLDTGGHERLGTLQHISARHAGYHTVFLIPLAVAQKGPNDAGCEAKL
jgi:hypothetical protein